MISNLAYVHPDAKIGENVTIEPFAYIAADVEIGDGCWVGPSAVIHDGARIGKNCKIHSFASIACKPQDLKFVGEVTTAVIGDNCDIRECVTISRGTASTGTTIVGSNNLIMAYTMAVMVAMTIISGIIYFKEYIPLIMGQSEKEEASAEAAPEEAVAETTEEDK